MKREILFRGKRVDNGEWVEGDLIQLDSRIMIADKGMTAYDKGHAHEHVDIECVEIITETLGQFTGLTDENGKRIFEGDIVRSELDWIFAVKWDSENARFIGYSRNNNIIYVGREPKAIVIGNIHDNPELT